MQPDCRWLTFTAVPKNRCPSITEVLTFHSDQGHPADQLQIFRPKLQAITSFVVEVAILRFHLEQERFFGGWNCAQRIFTSILFIAALLVSPWLQERSSSQQPGAPTALGNAPLSGEQVVDNLLAMDLERAHALHAYQGTRHYLLQYHGFAGTRSAEMVVDLKYQSPGTKEFTIRSSAGSKLIIGRVFKDRCRVRQLRTAH